MYFAPPIDYDKVMKKIPYGKVITVGKIREYFAKLSGADFTEPITAGIFISIVAGASYQRLEAEGHTIIKKGRKNIRYYVKDYDFFWFKTILVFFAFLILKVFKKDVTIFSERLISC